MALNVSLKSLTQPVLTTAGTAQQITTSTIQARSVVIYAAKTNAGAVYIGVDNASAKIGTGINLAAGESYTLEGDKQNGIPSMILLSSIYFDGATTGDKLVVQYLE